MVQTSAESLHFHVNECVAGQCLWRITGVRLSGSAQRMEPGSRVSVWQSHVSHLLPFSTVPTSAQTAFSSTATAGSTATGLTTRWDSTAAASRSVVFSLSLFSLFSLFFHRRLSPSPPITVCGAFHSSCAPYQSLLSIAIFLCRPSGCSSAAWLVDWQILHVLCFICQYHSF